MKYDCYVLSLSEYWDNNDSLGIYCIPKDITREGRKCLVQRVREQWERESGGRLDHEIRPNYAFTVTTGHNTSFPPRLEWHNANSDNTKSKLKNVCGRECEAGTKTKQPSELGGAFCFIFVFPLSTFFSLVCDWHSQCFQRSSLSGFQVQAG